jgi:peptidylprolyl isomerase
VIGRVFAGMAYVDLIEKGEPPAHPTKIVRAWFGEAPVDAATPPVADAAPPATSAPTLAAPGSLITAGAATVAEHQGPARAASGDTGTLAQKKPKAKAK